MHWNLTAETTNSGKVIFPYDTKGLSDAALGAKRYLGSWVIVADFWVEGSDSEEKGQAPACLLSSPSDGGSFPTTSQLFPSRVDVVVPTGLFLDLSQDVLAHAFLDQSGQAILVILDH